MLSKYAADVLDVVVLSFSSFSRFRNWQWLLKVAFFRDFIKVMDIKVGTPITVFLLEVKDVTRGEQHDEPMVPWFIFTFGNATGNTVVVCGQERNSCFTRKCPSTDSFFYVAIMPSTRSIPA